ncbi:MAG: hypothetical protein ACR2NM_11410 [Bythopirellula sp.]
MARTLRICGLFLVAFLLTASQRAPAQQQTEPVTADLSTPALKYFGRGKHTGIPKPKSRRPAALPQRVQFQGGKPFQHTNRGPTITPYLQLDTLESSVGVPNYYSRVLPQIQQQQVTQAQAIQLRRLQQQVRLAGGTAAITGARHGSVPTTGHSSQFLNVGGYFPTIER